MLAHQPGDSRKRSRAPVDESNAFHRDDQTHDVFRDPYRFRPWIGDDVAIIQPKAWRRDPHGCDDVGPQPGILERKEFSKTHSIPKPLVKAVSIFCLLRTSVTLLRPARDSL